jgi:hypothetical protein
VNLQSIRNSLQEGRTMRAQSLPFVAALVTIAFCSLSLSAKAQAAAGPGANRIKSPSPGILSRSESAAILPPSVFYRGQSATIQGRNSAGIKREDGKLVLVTLVDTGGYSTAVQETYQAYLLSEVPLTIGDQTLPPGAYGFGFISGDRMVVMDIGGNEILHATTTHDNNLKHPNPLQILADSTSPQHYLLYIGRTYIRFALGAQ